MSNSPICVLFAVAVAVCWCWCWLILLIEQLEGELYRTIRYDIGQTDLIIQIDAKHLSIRPSHLRMSAQ
jgi:hypothetical protein